MGCDVEVLLYTVESNERNELWPNMCHRLSHKLPSMNPIVPGAFVVPSMWISRYLGKGQCQLKVHSLCLADSLRPIYQGPFHESIHI